MTTVLGSCYTPPTTLNKDYAMNALPADLPMDRIRKLMAVTIDRGASETEASFASSKVQQILQEYGLSMAEIERRGGGTGDDGRRGRNDADRRAMYKWQADLMSALAENNFLKHWIEQQTKIDPAGKMRRSKQHVLLGRHINVQATLQMYDYLVDTFRRLANDQGYAHAHTTEREHHLFLGGVTERVIERLAEQRRHVEREAEGKRKRDEAMRNHSAYAPTGTSVALAEHYRDERQANQDLYDDFRWGLEPGTTACRRAEGKAREAAMTAEIERLVAEGIDDLVASYMVRNEMSRADAEAQMRKTNEFWAKYQAEQDAKPARKSRPSRSRAVYRGPSQAEQREADRRSSFAYNAGRASGDGVGLDKQVSVKNREKLT